MSDIKCAVCGEPWDMYGYPDNGDMKPWEYHLFRKGAGCPCCRGEAVHGAKDKTDYMLEHVKSVVFESEDPDSFELMNYPNAPKPEWKRPDDVVLFECAGCDAKILRNVDFGEKSDFAKYWAHPAVDKNWYGHLREFSDEPDEKEDVLEVDGQKYCPACALVCDSFGCRNVIFRNNTSANGTVLYGDTYDAGASFPNPLDEYHSGPICIHCLEATPTCSECGEYVNEDETCCESCKPNEHDEDDDAEAVLNQDKDDLPG